MLSDAKGEVQRGLEVVEFATRHSAPLQGRIQRGSRHGRRQLFAAPAARRRARASRRSISPRWCRCGCFRSRWRAATPSCSSQPRRIRQRRSQLARTSDAKPACRTACSTSCTATRKRSMRCSTHRKIEAISFVGSTPIAEYIYTRGRDRQARAGARRRQESHGGPAGCGSRTQTVDALMGAAYGSAGERCMAISVAVAVGDQVGDALVERLEEQADARSRSAPGRRARRGDGPAGHRRASTSACAATSTSASQRARRW